MQNKALYNLGNSYLYKQDYPQAIENYRKILENEAMNSELYKKNLKNFLFAKQQLQQQQKQQNKQNQNNKNDQQDQQKKQDQKQDQSQTNNDKQNQDKQTQKPISPSEVENLLNLIEQEEKKHLNKKEAVRGQRTNPKKVW